jgi:predicted transcriptional regulator
MNASLVDAAFCVLLANANQPMTAKEIAERIDRQPDVVVRTLGGPKIYQGIRPVFDE